jgi:mRNA interferase MazF
VPKLLVPAMGDIWYVDFSPQVGREQAGIRPALVVSNDKFNAVGNDLHIVCPLTTRDRGLRYHVPMDPIDGVLSRPSLIMCEQVKSQDMQRFLKYRGKAPDDIVEQVLEVIDGFFGSRHTDR